MLGVRLDDDLEARLTAVARTQGRSKSDIVRDVVRRYVDLHDAAFRAEAKRQSLAAAAEGWTEEDEAWERLGPLYDIEEPDENRDAAA